MKVNCAWLCGTILVTASCSFGWTADASRAVALNLAAAAVAANDCPEACCAGPDEITDGSSAVCTDFRVFLFTFMYGLGTWDATFDIADEGWVWVNKRNAVCPRYRSVSGVVVRSKIAHNDTPANHDSHDQNTVIFVDPGQRNILSTAGEDHDGDESPDTIEVEWEMGARPHEKHGDGAWPMFPKWAWPNVGDRAWSEGHWIFDCGHSTEIGGEDHYPSEIHPARAMAAMRNQSHVLPGTGVTPVPVTTTELWIHGRGGFAPSQLNCGMDIIVHGVDEDGDGFGDGDPDACHTKVTPIDTDFEFVVCLPPRPVLTALLRWSVEEGPYNTIPESEVAVDIEEVAAPGDCANDGVEGVDIYDSTTALRVRIPLAGSGKLPEDAYARRIFAGWVYPPDPPLRRFDLTINKMDLHDDSDDVPADDGELSFFWTNVDLAHNEWMRLSDFEVETCDDCGTFCFANCNTMNDYDDDDLCCNGELNFSGLSHDFYVRNGQSFTLRSTGYDQDCYDDNYGDHNLGIGMYIACHTIDIDEFGNNDPMTALPTAIDPGATTFGPPGYGVGNQDLPARKTIFIPQQAPDPPVPIIVSEYELEFSISEIPLSTEDTADLVVQKSCEFDGEVALTDEPFRCTITLTNPGPGLPRNVVVTDTVTTSAPDGSFTIDSASFQVGDGDEAACNMTGPASFSCAVGTVPVSGQAVVSLQITPTKPGVFRDRAEATTDSTDTDSNNNAAEATVEVYQQVDIDIQPGDGTNPVNLTKKGLVSIAVLTTPEFNAPAIDYSTVCFGDAEMPAERDCTESHNQGHLRDADRDRDADMFLHYEALETGIDPGDTTACIIGRTSDGIGFYGCDAIRIVP